MKYRKITMNMLIGLLLPIALKIRWIPNVYDAFFKGIYKYYDVRVESLGEFLYYIYGKSFFLEYFMHLLIILLPFQAIKDVYFNKKDIRFSFIKKCGVLSVIIIVWTLLWVPLRFEYLKFFIFNIGLGIIFTTLLYFAIDRYVEKTEVNPIT